MAVVLVTGQLLTHEVWGESLPALQAGHEVMLADHTRDDSIGGMAERLLAAAPAQFDLIGQAMGGFVAFEVLRRAPERVRRLALLTTLAPNDGPAQTKRRMGYIRLVEDGRYADVVEERIPILVHPARREDRPLLGIVRRMAEDTGAETFLIQQRAIMSRADSRPGLGQIRCPTLVVWGRQDGITTEQHATEIAAGIPGATLETIEDCGHLTTLEKPATTARLLAEWFGAA
ncbi:alpha/beta hydrolase [Phenylobacterium sp. J426]|uniref:alpha/beta fold hydrolase n=1 Tax=Phenylobacterium sp. J426 TaxID=2898439 RepID=UPI00215188FD|nr:alpha/beta hydrolase [Phenylobacterium sp. J426]MCR5872732.1 alpha/beta hydrolase [Phenylobacterium sp. J426]